MLCIRWQCFLLNVFNSFYVFNKKRGFNVFYSWGKRLLRLWLDMPQTRKDFLDTWFFFIARLELWTFVQVRSVLSVLWCCLGMNFWLIGLKLLGYSFPTELLWVMIMVTWKQASKDTLCNMATTLAKSFASIFKTIASNGLDFHMGRVQHFTDELLRLYSWS